MCVLNFSTTFLRKISHSKNNSARLYRILYIYIYTYGRVYIYISLHVIVAVVLVIFSGNFKFIDKFPKNFEIPNFMKIRPEGVQLFHTD